MKYILEYDGDNPQDVEDFHQAVSAKEVFEFLRIVEDNLFRPHRKHGYSTAYVPTHEDALALNEADQDTIEVLERVYYKLKNNYLRDA